MSIIVIYTIISLCALGVLAALILYFVAQKFMVIEDPRIDEVEGMLPGANCGGCGFPGCRGFAEAMVKADDISDLNCPVSDADGMVAIAAHLGHEASAADPKIAVLRCNGTCDNRAKTNHYDGAPNCTIVASLYVGDTGCTYGCLGHGECVDSCKFDAMYMDPITGLPVIDADKCVACGACVKACPKNIIELRNKGKKDRRIFVSCVNKDKGGVAKKACSVACIGCMKCQKVCPFEAITIENNLAYIDFNKCKLCRKCVPECPTDAIHELNFPPKKVAAPIIESLTKETPKENNHN
ncbi:MAG: Fe-S cluster domain-containing protein [Salinivirgaceae bacterium]|jgi:electron transport complex protein RnfB|nr:Fe-S cluster domain-containing protein [Salinivirgaceae bacterium]